MNSKLLTAQLARRGKVDWADSDRAYDSIVSLTKRYNTTKWNRMMDFQPRKLPVFDGWKEKQFYPFYLKNVRLSIHGMVLIALIVHR